MIYFLYGANTYAIGEGVRSLLDGLLQKNPAVVPERIDAADIEPNDLPDILQGTSLFSNQRVVILKNPSANKSVWTALESFVERVADTTELIIVDSAADKRTKTFKVLTKAADAREYAEFGPRNGARLQTWLINEAKRQNLSLSRDAAQLLIDRVGYEQWSLMHAVTKLALVEDASPERIRDIINPSPQANSFELFEAALRKNKDLVRNMLNDLRLTADPHALIGLLGAQAFQLALVANSSKTPVELGRLLGSSPYPLQKLNPVARTLSKSQVTSVVRAIAECDRDVKRSLAPPWTLIDRALQKIAS